MPVVESLTRQVSGSERREVSEEENKAVIRRWIEAYNERDMQAQADVRAPGYVAHVPGAPGPWTRRPGRSSSPPSGRPFPTFGSRWRTSLPRETWWRRVWPSMAPTAAAGYLLCDPPTFV